MIPFDKMPYTNFHELNLAYFIVHFREIFAEWETLYNNMVAWREQTDADLTLWKTDTLNAIEDYERDLTDAWDTWKSETALDITDWKNETLDALDAWKTAFQTLFDSTFSNLSQIKTDAEAARDAAVAAQDRAEAAAATLTLDPTLTSPTQAAQAKAVGDIIDNINNALGYTILDQNDRTLIHGIVDAEGKWLIEGIAHLSFQYSVHNLKSIMVTANSTRAAFVSFLASSAEQLESGQTPDFAGDETGRHRIAEGTTETLDVPKNCAYVLFAYKMTNVSEYSPEECRLIFSGGGYDILNSGIEENRSDIDNLTGNVQTLNVATEKMSSEILGMRNLQADKYTYDCTLEPGAIDGSGMNVNTTSHINYSCRTMGYTDTKGAQSMHVEFERSPDAVLPPSANNYYLYINFYDEEQAFISRNGGANVSFVEVNDIPENAKYFRISFTNTRQDDIENYEIDGSAQSTIVSTVLNLNTRIPMNGIVLGDSIAFGLWSYWDGNLRKNADDLYPGDISKTAAPIRISDWFAKYYGISIENIAKRGTGWVADTRHLGNAWEKAQETNFENYDFVALCFGVNDYINKIALGSISDNIIGTVIGNMIHVLEKIYADNPLIKVVVFSPLNTWGQYRDSESSPKVLYGDASTHYALGYDFNGSSYTLQALIDAMESVCDRYDIRHVVMSQGCTINVFNIKDILIDGLHPSQESMKAIASDMYHTMLFR